eukprot:CAMPEP_0202924058 /NCGR_PEP_ID=MMETSP1392-20130828/78776_1 /ASSEMBLY_ACC=CAM_ASM_000868 /TAXON_ID=225041 /ORGANISM="Chlamydomonas chlamydogama, Strain SAG 11-48b" /LENGTH=125 /DNA_ID=CAMNT_0049617771 /DNA_START=824 /DNA_END=1201 /DNA_ORIENTATION=-
MGPCEVRASAGTWLTGVEAEAGMEAEGGDCADSAAVPFNSMPFNSMPFAYTCCPGFCCSCTGTLFAALLALLLPRPWGSLRYCPGRTATSEVMRSRRSTCVALLPAAGPAMGLPLMNMELSDAQI